jgi:hypothetical protein
VSKKPGGWSAASRAGGTPPVARHPHHAKGAGPSARHLQREVNRLQRQVSHLQHSGKHPHSTAKHHPHKGSSKHKRRGLALGDMVACCAAEALAASLLLSSGLRASDADVLELFLATPGHDDDGASILATLEAAAEHGLAGTRPAWRELGGLVPDERGAERYEQDDCDVEEDRAERVEIVVGADHFPESLHASQRNGLILGVDLPGPHTVTVDAGGQWLTWGEVLPPFPGAVIEEAWAIIWP